MKRLWPLLLLIACGPPPLVIDEPDSGSPLADASVTIDAGADAGSIDSGIPDSGIPDAGPPCITRVTYGASWHRPAGHAAGFDDATGAVTWDGSCTQDTAGHGSIILGPSGDWVHVFHAWQAGNVGQAPGRLVLVDRVTFESDWPVMHAGPSTGSQPLP